MAFRDRAAVIESMTNLWNNTHAPSAGTTCAATVVPALPTTRVHLTNIGWSVANATLSTGPSSNLEVRHRSIAGTLIASWTINPIGLGSFQDQWSGMNLMGKKGAAMVVDFTAPVASITQKVSIAGWYETLGDG